MAVSDLLDIHNNGVMHDALFISKCYAIYGNVW